MTSGYNFRKGQGCSPLDLDRTPSRRATEGGSRKTQRASASSPSALPAVLPQSAWTIWQCDDRPEGAGWPNRCRQTTKIRQSPAGGEEPLAYTIENLLTVLHPHCPVKVDALCENRRRVEQRPTTVDVMMHWIGADRQLLNLTTALGGTSEVIVSTVYAHARAYVTVIVPHAGSARCAVTLPARIEKS